MNLENVIHDNTTIYNEPDSDTHMNSLVVELEHYRRQSEWLSLVNGLHGRLAGAVDLPAMLEAFSVWLMPLVDHDLLAYNNPARNRHHMLCSCHGPERQRIMDIASDILIQQPECSDSCSWTKEDYYIHNWHMDRFKGSGLLIIIRKDRKIGDYEGQLLTKGLKILSEPLQRALEYEDLYEQASRDSLTGLANRRVFDERIIPIMSQARRHGHPVSLACMDLDKFKQINDTYGHAVGDLVLQKVAITLERKIRDCDILARMGGDEFMLIMPDTNIEAAKILADRLCEAVGGIELPPSVPTTIGISIGVSEWNTDLDRKQWTENTDIALYKAKAQGRSRAYAI